MSVGRDSGSSRHTELEKELRHPTVDRDVLRGLDSSSFEVLEAWKKPSSTISKNLRQPRGDQPCLASSSHQFECPEAHQVENQRALGGLQPHLAGGARGS